MKLKSILSILTALLTGVIAVRAQAPANDNFINAQTIAGGTGSVAGNTSGATMEPGEPDVVDAFGGSFQQYNSVWFSWTAPRDGFVSFARDTFLAAYTGTAVNGLTPIDRNYGGINFSAIAGTVYQIAVTEGSPSEEGSFTLSWNQPNQNGVFGFSSATAQVGETDGGVQLLVERAVGTTGATTVHYTTTAGTATAGSDYTTTTGTLNFADGEASQPISIPIGDDATIEIPETFTVTLDTPTGGAELGEISTATVTIVSDESPGLLSFEVAAVGVSEMDNAVVMLNVLRVGGSNGSLSVDFATTAETATAGSDYTTTTGTLDFADGQTSATISVPIINDTEGEGQERFHVTLSNPSFAGAVGMPSEATVFIFSEDLPANDNFASAQVLTEESGSVPGIDVGATSEGSLENDILGPVVWYRFVAPISGVVRFSVAPADDGTFVKIFRGSTYGNLKFLSESAPVPGQPVSALPVATASVSAGAAYYIAVGGGGGSFTLSWQTSTSGLLSLAGFQSFFDPASLVMSNRYIASEKGGPLTIKVRRSGGLDGTVSVTYTAAEDIDALFGETPVASGSVDFTPVSGTLTFAPGEAEKTFNIPILDDAEQEETKHFLVTLSTPTGGALLGSATLAQVQIFDDEGDPANDDLAKAQPIFGGSGQINGDNTLADPEAFETFTTGGVGHSIWYRWVAPVSGAASFLGAINNPGSGVVDIFQSSVNGLKLLASGAGTDDLSGIPKPANFAVSGGEIFFVRVDGWVQTGETGPTTLNWSVATGGIISFARPTFSATEDLEAALIVTLKRESGLSNSASVTVTTSDGSAMDGIDYTGIATTVVFNPGESSKSVSILLLGDTEVEGDESIMVSLRNVTGALVAGSTDILATILDDDDNPLNDYFEDRQLLSVANGTRSGDTTVGASTESGEPDHGQYSVWYRWKAPATGLGVVTFALDGSSSMPGPTVTVYTGTAIDALTQVAQGIDRVSFPTTPGTTYIVAVSDRGMFDEFIGFSFYSPSSFNLRHTFEPAGSVFAFDQSSFQVDETGGTVQITVNRIGSTADTASVDLATADLSAMDGADYGGFTTTLNFEAGETSLTFPVDILDDGEREGNENFVMQLSNAIGAVLAGGDPTSAVVTILDDDDDVNSADNDAFANALLLVGSNPVVSGFSDGATTELDEPRVLGDAPSQSLWYRWVAPAAGFARVALDSPAHAVSAYTGTALNNLAEVNFLTGGAFAVTSGTTYFLSVNTTGGSAFELSLVFGAGSILRFDDATLFVSENQGSAAVTILRTNTAGAVSVRFRASGLTATEGSDFTPVDTIVDFADGVASQTVNVPILDDALSEGVEAVQVSLSEPTGDAIVAYGLNDVVKLLIQDDESAPANDNFAAAVAISGPFGTTFGNNFNGSPEAGEPDHAHHSSGGSIWYRWTAPFPGTVTFRTAGSSITTVLAAYTGSTVGALTEVASAGSSQPDGTSEISFTAAEGVAYSVAVDSEDGGSQGSIVLNWTMAQPGVLGFNPVSYSVGESGASVILTVARTSGSLGAIGVSFTTASGSATAGSDFTTTSGTLSFAAGETSKTITVPLLGDSLFESDETFTVILSAATGGGSLGAATATVTLISDDSEANDDFVNAVPINGSFGAKSGANTNATRESGESNHEGVSTGHSIWYRWTAPVTGSVTFTTTGSGFDTVLSAYTGTAVGNLTRVGGNNNVSGADTTSRATFPVTAGTVYPVAVDSATTATGSVALSWTMIAADTFGFSQANYSVSETAGTVVLTVIRSSGTGGAADVTFATFNGTAIGTEDFAPVSGTLAFGAGETSKTITVPLTNDSDFERSESFTVVLGSASNGAVLGVSTATVTLSSNDAFLPAVASFAALVNPGGSHATSGLLTVTTAATASFTGKLLLGGKPLVVKGSFDAFGSALVTIPRRGAGPLSIAMQLGNDGSEITGRVYDGTVDLDFTGEASFYDGRTKFYPQPGPFTVALRPTSLAPEVPQGLGSAAMTVSSKGTFIIKGGQLGDAASFSATGFIAKSGEVQFYSLLYKGLGSLAGVVTFSDETTTDATGTLQWNKPAGVAKQKYFAAGIETDLDLQASFFTKPVPGTRIDNAFDADNGAAAIVLDNGDLDAPMDVVGALDVKNKIAVTAPVPFTLAGNSKTGLFTGTFTPASGAKTKFKGVFLQKSDEALGQFFGPNLSGSVSVTPGGP